MKLADQPWWTEADAAELELLSLELIGPLWRHFSRCERCVLGPGSCDKAREAGERGLAAILDWRHKRILQSKVAYYRSREEAA